jgi:dolichol-phosphate mannosyltransferase
MSAEVTEVSLIIPCFNEKLNIDKLVENLNLYCKEHSELNMEVVFVDDNSSDGTYEKILESKHEFYSCRLIRLASNSGSHIAFRAGCSIASYGLVTATSSDLQHPLSLIHECVHEMQTKRIDCVIAIRGNDYYDGLFEKTFSKLYTALVRKFAIASYPNGGFDIFMINKRYKDLLNSNVENNSSVNLQILSIGLPFSTITYVKGKRYRGKSKWTLTKKIKLLIDTFIAFSYAPIRLVTLAGIVMFLLGISCTTYLVLRKLLVGDLILGWTMAYSTVICGFGLTNISLGVIAEYLWRTLDAVRKRPVYTIERDEVLNLQPKT